MWPPSEATQANVAPGVLEALLRLSCVTEQVRTLSGPASAFGAAIFCVTKASSVAVQPLTGSVTVTVYVPAASTSGVAVLPPETMWPPSEATQAYVAPG